MRKIEGRAPANCRGQGGNHRAARCSETIAKARIEFGRCVCCVLLTLGTIFSVAAYLFAAHLERFGIANIAQIQDI